MFVIVCFIKNGSCSMRFKEGVQWEKDNFLTKISTTAWNTLDKGSFKKTKKQ